MFFWLDSGTPVRRHSSVSFRDEGPCEELSPRTYSAFCVTFALETCESEVRKQAWRATLLNFIVAK